MGEIMLDMGFLFYKKILKIRVGPLLAVLDVQDNGKISEEVEIPYWGLAFGGGSFIAGILSVFHILFLFIHHRLAAEQLKQLVQALPLLIQ